MRGVGRVLNPNKFPYSSSWAASFSSGSGRGRGGAAFPPPDTVSPIGKPPDGNNEAEETPAESRFTAGRGRPGLPTQTKTMPENHGRGQGTPEPAQAGSEHSPFQAWAPENSIGPAAGRGRGTIPLGKRDQKPVPKGPGAVESFQKPKDPSEGFGRGKPEQQSSGGGPVLNEVNRHAHPGRRATPRSADGGQGPRLPESLPAPPRPKGAEAVKQALAILAKRAEAAGDTVGPGRGGSGDRGRGRGKGRGRGRGRGRRQMQRGGAEHEGIGLESDDDEMLGNNDEMKDELVKIFGEVTWNEMSKGIDAVCEKVIPNPAKDAEKDALHTNYLLEFEPEYAMEEFGTNPDIDEKPPISLREFLEDSKPLLFAAGQLETEEEWKEHLDDAMKAVPYTRELVHYYAGYGRLTARKEQEHLKAVASQCPDHAHQSVKNLTDRAVLSLQSNPGWGFDKKYLCMKRLVGDVTQYYKEKHSR